MREKLNEFLHVDLARLNVAGWLLMLAALGAVGGGIALFAVSTEGEGGGRPPPLPRWVGFLCWAAGALLFFGGRWALDALGVGVYRKRAGEVKRREISPGPAAFQQGREAAGTTGAGARIALAVLFSLFAVAFAVLAALYGEYFPKGPWPFYGMGAACAVLAVVFLVAKRRPGAP